MDQNQLKKLAAEAALAYIEPGMILGVGSGSTVDFFIDALPAVKSKIDAAVSSSNKTSDKLKKLGIQLIDLNSVSELSVSDCKHLK